MGKNNRKIKIGEDKVVKKLYKAKTKWVVQGGLFGALLLGAFLGTGTVTAHAAEETGNAVIQDVQAKSAEATVTTAKTVSLTTTTPAKTTAAKTDSVAATVSGAEKVSDIAPVTAADAQPKSENVVAPVAGTGAQAGTQTSKTQTVQTTSAVTSETATTPVTETKYAAAAVKVTAPVTKATPATSPVVAETEKSVTDANATPTKTATASLPVGSPKSGPATATQPTATAPITVSSADAKNQFVYLDVIKEFDDTGVVQLTDTGTGESGATFLANRIDMTQDFVLQGQINAGKSDGADGMSVGLHYGAIEKGGDANAVGIGGLDNTFGFKVDSYPNLASDKDLSKPDIKYAVDPLDAPFAGFVYADATPNHKASTYSDASNSSDPANPQKVTLDDTFKSFSMTYTASTNALQIDYDGKTWTKDVKDWVDKDNKQYWNLYMSASTGMKSNNQLFKLDSMTYTPEFSVNASYSDETTGQALNSGSVQVPVAYQYNKDTKKIEYTVQAPTIAGYVYDDVKQTNSVNGSLNGSLDETNRTVNVKIEYVDAATAHAAALSALQATTPVSNENDVKTAKTNVEAEIRNGQATVSSLAQVTKQLTDAKAVAQGARGTADAAATTARNDADKYKSDTDVADAIHKLADLQTKAAADDPNALTAVIEATTKDLADKVVTLVQNTAKQTVTATTPVSNESGVKQAKADLETLLSNPNATIAELETATKTLADAKATAQSARDTAKTNATAALNEAKNESQDADVVAAAKGLNDLLTKADADDPNALTAAIKATTKDLADKVMAAAKTKANQTVTATTPVSNESGVKQAKADLETLLSNPNATVTELETATKTLADAKAAAQSARDTANAAATTARNDADKYKSDTDVADAIHKLEDLQTKAAADDPNALTAVIEATTKDLADKVVTSVQNTAKQTVTATTPVSNEPGVKQLKADLETLLSNPNATVTELETATKTLADAKAAAQSARDTANAAANTALNDAANHNTDTDVADAIHKLEDLQTKAAADDPNALTAAIETATTNLAGKIVTAVQNTAKQTVAATTPVSNEPGVKQPKADLETLLSNPNATIAELETATKTLADAKAAAQSARDTANVAATTALNDAAKHKTDTDVADAIQKLGGLQTKAAADDPNALTAAIETATTNLASKIVTAVQNTAKQTVAATTPVSNEPGVKQPKADLETLLSNPNATIAELETATKTLADAKAAAQSARNTANVAATTALNDAAKHNTDTDVADAIQKLEGLQMKAAADDPNALTAAIETATTNLAGKIVTVVQNTARQTVAATTPVSNEPGVKQAKTDLKTLLSNPNATVTELETATKTLADAKAAAQSARDKANAAATTALNDAAKHKTDTDVADAIQKLEGLQTKAAADDPNALTAAIETATTNLAGKIVTAVQNTAKQTVAATTPVSNEPGVKQPKADLETLLSNPNATIAELETATKTLADAKAAAQSARDTANAAANTALNDADKYKTDTDVADAIHKLEELQTKAVADDPKALTAAIETATTNLAGKVETAVQNTAKQTVAATTPVSNEPGVKQAKADLETLLSNPNATVTELETATKTLADAKTAAQNARDNANAAATTALNEANNYKNDTDVADAIRKLADLQTKAAADDPNALTAAIETATTNLAGKIVTTVQNTAKQTVAATIPVSNEPGVKQAKTDLETLLSNPSATVSELETATKTLADAKATAQSARDTAKTNATAALNEAKNESQDADVVTAAKGLNDLLTKADADDPNALTAAIETATTTLAGKIVTAVQNTAKQTVAATTPVSNEPGVKQPKADLETLLSNPNATIAELETATKTLVDAKTAAQTARDAANTEATKALADAASETHDADVSGAIKALNELLKNAATDNPNALTAAIKAATTDLEAKIVIAANRKANQSSTTVGVQYFDDSNPTDRKSNLSDTDGEGNTSQDAQVTDNLAGAPTNVQNSTSESVTNAEHVLSDTDGKPSETKISYDAQTGAQTFGNENNVEKDVNASATNVLSKEDDLPQTGDEANSALTLGGLILMGVLGFLGINHRRKED